MDGGMIYKDAHSLAQLTHPPYRNYPPEIVKEFRGYFSRFWRELGWEFDK